MGKLLTKEQWDSLEDDFFWITHANIIIDKNKVNNNTLRQIIIKWCKKNLNGWFYYEDDYWIFESQKDAITLKSVILSGYFDQDHGALEKQ